MFQCAIEVGKDGVLEVAYDGCDPSSDLSGYLNREARPPNATDTISRLTQNLVSPPKEKPS